MKILILAAMDKEAALLAELLENKVQTVEDGIRVVKGNVGANGVYLAKCGIGKVNSAINALKLIRVLKPDLVINSGVAGGAGVPVGTLLVPDRIAYHDVWCGPGTEFGAPDGYPVFFTPDKDVVSKALCDSDSHTQTGLLCSGDKFISNHDEIEDIRFHFPGVKAVDMESASIAQVATSEGIPFAIIRIVSDTPGEGDNISQYEDFWTSAPEITFKTVNNLLLKL